MKYCRILLCMTALAALSADWHCMGRRLSRRRICAELRSFHDDGPGNSRHGAVAGCAYRQSSPGIALMFLSTDRRFPAAHSHPYQRVLYNHRNPGGERHSEQSRQVSILPGKRLTAYTTATARDCHTLNMPPQSSRTNDLWISGQTNWTQYAVSPVGASLQLVANVPTGGMGGFYEVVQTNTVSTEYKTYQFNPGYSTMNYRADQMGRHMLYFVVNNQPSNVVIVDVFSQALGKDLKGGHTFPPSRLNFRHLSLHDQYDSSCSIGQLHSSHSFSGLTVLLAHFHLALPANVKLPARCVSVKPPGQ